MIILDRTSDPLIRVNDKLVLRKSYLDSNERIIDYLDYNKRCKICSMVMDPDEKSVCKYCLGDW